MSTAVFSTANESYAVSSIHYAGPVAEIPAEKRKGSTTHSFRIITSMGSVFCYFAGEETAKKARGALTGMMERCKPSTYKHGFDTIDTQKIVSFSQIVPLKSQTNGHTHAVIVTVESASDKNNQVWLRYRSEDNARKGRHALYAAIHAANRLVPTGMEENSGAESVKEEIRTC